MLMKPFEVIRMAERPVPKASYAELSGDYNPVHMDKEVTGIINESKGIYKFKTYIKNQTGDMVLDTYAIIKYKKEIL